MNLKSDKVEVDFTPAIGIALMAAEEVYRKYDRVVTITSGSERSAKHSITSLHYSGNAVDIRTQNPINGIQYFDDPIKIKTEIKKKLNIDFDVLFEHDHIHMEYQPRGR